MKQRIITGLKLALVCGVPLYFGGIYLYVLLALTTIVGLYEFIKMRSQGFNAILYFVMLAYVMAILFLDIKYLLVSNILLLIILFCLAIASEDFTTDDVGMNFAFSFLFANALNAIIMIYSYGWKLMIYLIIAALLCDAGAYFVGYLFGKHKLNKRISPKKTIEGAIGGVLVGFILSIVYAYYILLPLNYFTFNFYLLCSFVLPIISEFGDLAFSLIKRHYAIKDFGNIFPGHGGVLDRIDSLIFALVIFEAFVVVVL